MKVLIIIAAVLTIFCLGFWLGYSIKQRLYQLIISELEKSNVEMHEQVNTFIKEYISIVDRMSERRIEKLERIGVQAQK